MGEMDAWKQDLQKQSQDFSAEKLSANRVADSGQDKLAQDKLALGQSRLAEASPEVLTLAQQRIHRYITPARNTIYIFFFNSALKEPTELN